MNLFLLKCMKDFRLELLPLLFKDCKVESINVKR